MVIGGGSLTPEQAIELVVFRHVYGLDRVGVAALPLWERATLLACGRQVMGFDDVVTGDGSASVIDGGPGTSAADLQRLIG